MPEIKPNPKPPTTETILRAQAVRKTFRMGDSDIHVLKHEIGRASCRERV